MSIVIDRVTRVGDVGEPGYSVYGQELPSCTGSGTQDDWHGATQDNLSAVLPTCYITESVYSYLTQDEIESVRSRIRGIVQNNYAYKYYKGRDIFNKQIYCWDYVPDVVIRDLPPLDPCEGVVCDPTCVEYDLYSNVCEDGACVQGDIIKTNDPECGYVPPEFPNIYDTIIDNSVIIIAGLFAGAIVITSMASMED